MEDKMDVDSETEQQREEATSHPQHAAVADNKPAIIDALPYIDMTHEDYEQYAAYLIEQEMQNLDPNDSSTAKVGSLPPLKFRSPLLEEEYQRVAKSNGEVTEDRPDYGEAAIQPPSTSDGTLQEWQQAVQQAKIVYEKVRIRARLLELEKEGLTAQQWKQYNALLSSIQEQGLDPLLLAQRQKVDQINLQRQEHQQDKVGKELSVRTMQQEQLVQKVYQLKVAIATMEQEISDMRPSSVP